MNTYLVTTKDTHQEVYEYKALQPIEWADYPFTLFDHTLASDPVVSQPADPASKYLIDIGPFFDRFKTAKMDILTSTDQTVRAIVQDTMVRKWVDLKRSDVLNAINAIASIIPSVTPDIKDAVINDPVGPLENLALRKTYFVGE